MSKKIRESISKDASEVLVFSSGVLSQPHSLKTYWRTNPLAHFKSSRVLPLAHEEDIVILAATLDRPYYEWLRSIGFGPQTVIEYDQLEVQKSAEQMVVENPEPVIAAIQASGRKPLFVPYYSGSASHQAAKAIGAELFGSEEKTTLKFFSKDTFKEECERLEIPVVRGATHRVESGSELNFVELEQLVTQLLENHNAVILKGTLGASGSSLFTTSGNDVREVYEKMKANRDEEILVEPFLKVIASPNDQWIINRDREIFHLGLSAQLFEGLKHAGNLRGQYFSPRIFNEIQGISKKIVNHMHSEGYVGILGIDYIISDDGIFPIENNARFNGSTFSFGIIDNIEERLGPVACWKFFNAKTKPCSFTELTELIEPILYNNHRLNCVFPHDCDALHITGQFAPLLVAEDIYHIEYLEESLKSLGIERI